MLNSKKISVIIIAYQNSGCLEKCLTSLQKKISKVVDWEIIIVNNDPYQDVKHLSVDYSNIKVIDHRKNVGFGAGVNLGMREASGEFLFILNPDTEIITDNVQEVIEQFNRDEKLGIIGAGILDRMGKSQEWSAGKEISFYDLIRNNLGISRSKLFWDSSKKIICDWVSGTAFFIKRDLFNEVDGFDENFFMYFEDIDLCRRVKKRGKKILFFPEFKVFHISGKSYLDKRLQKKDYYDSMEYYFQKHKSWWQYVLIKLARNILTKV